MQRTLPCGAAAARCASSANECVSTPQGRQAVGAAFRAHLIIQAVPSCYPPVTATGFIRHIPLQRSRCTEAPRHISHKRLRGPKNV